MSERPFIRRPRSTSTQEALQEAEGIMRELETKLSSPLMTFEYCDHLYWLALKRLRQIEGLAYRDKGSLEDKVRELHDRASDLALEKETGPTFRFEPRILTSSQESAERRRRLKLK